MTNKTALVSTTSAIASTPVSGGSYARDPVTGALTLVEEGTPALPVLRHDADGEAAIPPDSDAAPTSTSATPQKAD